MKELTLSEAKKQANKASLDGEPFYVLRHKESGEYAIVRHRFLSMWLDVFDVLPLYNGKYRKCDVFADNPGTASLVVEEGQQ